MAITITLTICKGFIRHHTTTSAPSKFFASFFLLVIIIPGKMSQAQTGIRLQCAIALDYTFIMTLDEQASE
jgi:hypothetical protein